MKAPPAELFVPIYLFDVDERTLSPSTFREERALTHSLCQ